MRAGLGLMAGFLGLAAVAQLNDPDALIWMCVYGLPALVTLCAFIKTRVMDSGWWWASCVVVFVGDLLFATIVMADYIRQQRVSLNIISTEEGRESAGLLIVLSWLLILLLSSSSLRSGSFWQRNIFVAFAVIPVMSWIGYKYYIQKSIVVPEHCKGVI